VHITSLFSSAHDAISGQPELKHAAINITKLKAKAHAQIYSRQALPELLLEQVCNYWTKTKLTHGFQYQLALITNINEVSTQKSIDNVHAWFELFFENFAAHSQVQSFQKYSEINALKLVDKRLSLAAFFQQSDPNDHPQIEEQITIVEQSSWLDSLLEKSELDEESARDILRKAPGKEFTQGRLICSCFQVREKTIISAISDTCNSVEKLGEKLKCGTNCGSCRSELANLVVTNKIEQEAEHRNEIEISTQRSTAHKTDAAQLTIPIKHIEALK
jgi:assimilatory nitrate reductase catalytic subunit